MLPDPATHRLLTHAWSTLGGRPSALERLDVRGTTDGLLPSVFPAMPAMVAAVSATTLAAAELDAARTQRPAAPATVETEHVALAARSERYARLGGTATENLFAPLSRFWRTADGWLRLHTNYSWHRDRALRVLGCDEEPASVEQAVRRWRGADLEDALAAAGALGYAVRSLEEWGVHPQGRAVASLPLLESTLHHADGTTSAGGRLVSGSRFAEGLRVLDLTRVIAGPVATRMLAAWGADVLRVDSPRLPEIPGQTLDTLSGKRSALLDFAEPDGRRRLEDLLAAADVVVQGYRPGALAAYGLGAEALADRHPHLSVVTLSAWGRTGPWSARRGFDSLVQCPTGIAAAEGGGDQPGKLPAQLLDHATGYLAAAAALLSLARVAHGDPPSSVSLSLAQTAAWLTGGGPEPMPSAAAREPSPEDYLVTLAGRAAPAQVIAPPGRVAGRHPAWTTTAEFGSQPAAFR